MPDHAPSYPTNPDPCPFCLSQSRQIHDEIEKKSPCPLNTNIEDRSSTYPRSFSVAIFASGRVGATCLGEGKIGTTFEASVVASNKMGGKVRKTEGEEVVVELDAPQSVQDVLNVT